VVPLEKLFPIFFQHYYMVRKEDPAGSMQFNDLKVPFQISVKGVQ
jgi:hypothetical protein